MPMLLITMNNILHEFEDSQNENTRLRNIIILLVSSLVTCFWGATLVNYFSIGFTNIEPLDIYILPGGTLIIGFVIYLFAKKNQIGWFLLSLILAFLLGLFINSVRTITFDSWQQPESWSQLLLIVMFFITLASVILLFHSKTKKCLAISNIMFIICISLCVLVSIGSYFLII